MAQMSEIADVIEDATNESVQLDDDGQCLYLKLKNKDLIDNENIAKNLNDEFKRLFYDKLQVQDIIWDLFWNYMIDGRIYYERIINKAKPSEGLISLKKLPSESMDYYINPQTGKITHFFQYLKGTKPIFNSIEEAEKSKDIIVFEPQQISFINYGVYGKDKFDILGYLDKAKIPYNQLKLLETSVIIYRIIRAPERFVFRIDTGNMPMEKAMAFVEKVKQKMSKKQTYNPSTGRLSQEPEILSLLENFYLPQSSDGRGSQIETVGGNSAGFTELDDIYYFARKLYRALKYPMSRVTAEQEKRSADVLFGGSNVGEITRDEVKWSKFLERQQNKFCRDFNRIFLLHLDFKGLKKQYNLDESKFDITMMSPSNYQDQIEQNFLETRFQNYSAVADRPEISKYYAMQKYLDWTEDEIRENVSGFAKDKELGLVKEEGF
jgi:hypothetical protein